MAKTEKKSSSAKATVDKETKKTTEKPATAKKVTASTKKPAAKKAAEPKKAAPKAVAAKTPVKKAAPKKAVAVKKVAAKKPAKKSTGIKPVGHGVGRRKKSIARVWLRRGKGTITINGRPFKEYFDTEITRLSASTPMRLVDEAQKYDVEANIRGGGLWGQADALKLGISRALLKINEGLRPELRKLGLLTVDARVKERKKPGQPGARRKFQFVKR